MRFVAYNSRQGLAFADEVSRLAFGDMDSAFLMDVVRRLPATIGFLISKEGGITSNNELSSGLALRTSRLGKSCRAVLWYAVPIRMSATPTCLWLSFPATLATTVHWQRLSNV